MVVGALRSPLTDAAHAAAGRPSFYDDRIFWRVLMTSRAMGFGGIKFSRRWPSRDPRIGPSQRLPSTRATNPLATPYAGIFRRKGMASSAMGFASIDGRQRIAPQRINATANQFQVPWIYTAPIAAQVIQLKSFRNFAPKCTIDDSVR